MRAGDVLTVIDTLGLLEASLGLVKAIITYQMEPTKEVGPQPDAWRGALYQLDEAAEVIATQVATMDRWLHPETGGAQ